MFIIAKPNQVIYEKLIHRNRLFTQEISTHRIWIIIPESLATDINVSFQ